MKMTYSRDPHSGHSLGEQHTRYSDGTEKDGYVLTDLQLPIGGFTRTINT